MDRSEDTPPIQSYIPDVISLCIPLGLMLWNHAALSWPELVWVGFFLATGLIRLPFQIRNKVNEITVDENTAQERILLMGVFLTMGILPVLYLATKNSAWDVLAFAGYNLPAWMPTLGACLIVPYAFLFWRSHYDLGRNWSAKLEMREKHHLITEGVYKRMRHPMYAALWLFVIAQPLLIQNLIAGGLIIVAFGTLYILRVPKEEEMMLAKFGVDYRAYMDRTGRILPKLS